MLSKSPCRIRLAGVSQLPPRARTAGIATGIGESAGRNASGGNEAHGSEHVRQRLERGDASGHQGGKELHGIQAEIARALQFGRRSDAGIGRRPRGLGRADHAFVETRRNDGSRSRVERRFGLRGRQHRPAPATASGASRATAPRQSNAASLRNSTSMMDLPPVARACEARIAVSASSAWTRAISGACWSRSSISFFTVNESFPRRHSARSEMGEGKRLRSVSFARSRNGAELCSATGAQNFLLLAA